MATEIKVPSVGESITEVIVSQWLKEEGSEVRKDEPLVTLETDKVNVEVTAAADGVLGRRRRGNGETARVGEVIGEIVAAAEGHAGARAQVEPASAPVTSKPSAPPRPAAGEAKTAAERAPPSADPRPAAPSDQQLAERPGAGFVMPAAARAAEGRGIDPSGVTGTGPGGRVLKEDVERRPQEAKAASAPAPAPAPSTPPPARPPVAGRAGAAGSGGDALEQVVPMSPMRRRIAERLVSVQQTAAILTTFNEVDMSAVMQLRRSHQDAFVKAHGVKLGFMSFFVKAAVDALRAYPEVNAEIRGSDLVYHHFFDIGVAVGSERGLVVPVLRRAELMGLADVERAIADFGKRAQSGQIKLEEMQGGTFTITNGGTFGSLMSTPILNPPQSGILGMHNIVERPVGVDGQVVLRPMMYIALSYDHRIVDGRGAVSFLRRIKQCIEEPARMLMEV